MDLALKYRSILSYACASLIPWSRIIKILNVTTFWLKAVFEVEYYIGICQEAFCFFFSV